MLVGQGEDECEVVGCEFVVAGRHAPALLDLVEEPFDQITCAIQAGTKADWIFSMSPWRDVCPRAMLADKCPDPVSIISAISQEHCSRLEARQELGGKSVVVSFPSCERESYRQAVLSTTA